MTFELTDLSSGTQTISAPPSTRPTHISHSKTHHGRPCVAISHRSGPHHTPRALPQRPPAVHRRGVSNGPRPPRDDRPGPARRRVERGEGRSAAGTEGSAGELAVAGTAGRRPDGRRMDVPSRRRLPTRCARRGKCATLLASTPRACAAAGFKLPERDPSTGAAVVGHAVPNFP